MKKSLILAAVFTGIALATPAVGADRTDGEVTKVDTRRDRVTIKHGPIENLDMPAMTMVFEVADPAMMQRLTVGNAIRFKAERIEGKLTITELE